jgi:hypothetical protein
MSFRQYRRQIAELRRQIDTGTTRLLMADGIERILPGSGDYFVSLFCYAGQMAHGSLQEEGRRPKYETHLAWLREAAEIQQPFGSDIAGVLRGLLRSSFLSRTADTADYEPDAPNESHAVLGAEGQRGRPGAEVGRVRGPEHAGIASRSGLGLLRQRC